MTITTQPGKDRGRLGILIPVLLAAAVYLPSTATRAVIDYDEGYYSQAAKQMVDGGDWVTPYANGVRFLEKPPLMYWLTAVSFLVFGVNEFALRLPTSLGVIALVLVIVLMARRASGQRIAIVAGLCAACSVGTYLFTREALHDIWLVLFITLALYAFLEWYLDPVHDRLRALLFYAALAGAVMCKSLIGVAFPIGIVVVFFLLSREWPKWRTLHVLPGSLLFLTLAVPWHWLAATRNPDFLWHFFVNEQFLRFLGKHDPPVLWDVPLPTFLALILVWFFPWTAFLPAASGASRKPTSRGEGALVKLVLAWVFVILGFYTISARLEHYTFPIIPALSLLVGLALGRNDDGKAVRWAFRGLAVFGVTVLVVAASAGVWLVATGHEFTDVPTGRTGIVYETDFSILSDMPAPIMRNLLRPAVITVLALTIGLPAALWFENRRRRMQAVMTVAAVMVVICGMVHWSLITCEDMISSRKFALAIAREARAGDHLVVVGDYESANSLSFYQPLPVNVVDGVAYALIPGMKYRDAPRIVLTWKEFAALWQSEDRVFILVSSARLGELRLRGLEMLKVLDRVLVRNH